MFALLINRVDRHKYYQNTRPFLLVQSETQYSIAHPLRGGSACEDYCSLVGAV